MTHAPLNLTLEGRALGARAGSGFWRDIEEWGAQRVGRSHEGLEVGEFAPGADEPPEGLSRRRFVQLMGASMALAGVQACSRQPPERIVPHAEAPERLIPGRPVAYATATVLAGYARGVLVTTHEGRPTKVEGNPDHPDSLGATDVFDQASVLSLYDPDRSRAVRHLGTVTTWERFLAAWAEALGTGGEGAPGPVAVLTGNLTSPTLLAQVRAFLERHPGARWYVHEPTLGRAPREPIPLLGVGRAGVIVAIDSDFLHMGPGHVRYAREFAERRRVLEGRTDMNRLYAAEPMPTVTGAKADERLAAAPSRIGLLVRALLARVAGEGATPGLTSRESSWVEAAASDLRRHRGESLVVAGPTQPPRVRAMVRAMNGALGNLGATVREIEPFDAAADPAAGTLADLVADAPSIGALVVLGCNPVSTAPADVAFGERMERIPLRVHHGLHVDETARLCHWHLPATHEFEMWSDGRSHDGTASVIQPLILPLHGGWSPHELLAALGGERAPDAYGIVRAQWRESTGLEGEAFDLWWRRTLHAGLVPQSGARGVEGAALAEGRGEAEAPSEARGGEPDGLEVCIRADPRVFDGRYANNAWLQELPKPITMLTWDNAAIMNPATAERLGVDNERLVEVRDADRRVEAPVWVVPGVADGTIVVHLGYGRPHAGAVARGAGFDAFGLVTSASPWCVAGARVTALEGRLPLATTQQHQRLEGRPLYRSATIEEFRRDPHGVAGPHPDAPAHSLMPEHREESGEHQWGMSIDLTSCIGCGVCTVACQAENNIPTVGKEEVRRGREMHWIRVDRYYAGTPRDPTIHHQPVTCMHCEHAPCEVVCPTGATQHTVEGLNAMVYNRCVGTRYCSNNCPYKVRRFNFFDYVPAERQAAVLRMWRNPNVTVRSRGIMEKCTYCVQRIEAARIDARREGRSIGPGEVVPACAAACPTRAIVFGDVNGAGSEVAALKAQPHDYSMLAELNTRPRTSYLVELRNPRRPPERDETRGPEEDAHS